MFDTYYSDSNRTEYVPYEKTVKEIRAPTDDSIRIYEETKEKAYKSILDSLSVNDNKVNYKYQIYKDIYSYKTLLHFSIKLNGTEFVDKVELDLDISNKHKTAEVIYKKLSEKIASLFFDNFKF